MYGGETWKFRKSLEKQNQKFRKINGKINAKDKSN